MRHWAWADAPREPSEAATWPVGMLDVEFIERANVGASSLHRLAGVPPNTRVDAAQMADGLPLAVVVADAGSRVVEPFRAGLENRQEPSIVGLSGAGSVFAEPPRWVRPDPAPTRGRPRSRAHLGDDALRPSTVADLAGRTPAYPGALAGGNEVSAIS
jgi:hypothetical protein